MGIALCVPLARPQNKANRSRMETRNRSVIASQETTTEDEEVARKSEFTVQEEQLIRDMVLEMETPDAAAVATGTQ
jgi:hypothetical protein